MKWAVLHVRPVRRAVLPAVLLAMVATGCAAKGSTANPAGSGSPAPSVSPNGTIVQITQADAGRVTTLHVGDTLRILLGPPMGQGPYDWELRAYPRASMALLGKTPQREEFDLLAVAPGKGTISLVGKVRCQG